MTFRRIADDPPRAPGEAGLVFQFVRELAEYEKLTHEVEATEAMIDAALFGETRACSATSPNGTASRPALRSGF